MRKILNGFKIIVFVVLILALFVGVTKYNANKTYDERKASEKLTTIDTYSMNNYCKANCDAVMNALKKCDREALAALMINPDGVDSVMEFADWGKADFENAVSMGSGSLTKEPDENGRQDVSERFFVKIGKTKYMLFVETVTSRLGRDNDGVSAVAVTTFSHFDATDYAWNGEDDGESAVAGQLYWSK